MRSPNRLRPPLLLAALGVARAARLNMTAIGAHNGTSRFECWELDAPFVSSNQTGLVDTRTTALGGVAEMTYNVVPASFDGGFHPAPCNQWACPSPPLPSPPTGPGPEGTD